MIDPRAMPYEPIIVPETTDTKVVIGTIRDQATLSLEREILPVEPPLPPAAQVYGERVYTDTQASAEPQMAAVNAEILASMTASRYEPLVEVIKPDRAPIVGVQAGSITPVSDVIVPPEIRALVNKAFADAAAIIYPASKMQLSAQQTQWLNDFIGEMVALRDAVALFDASTNAVRSTIDVRAWIPAAQSISKNAAVLAGGLQGGAATTTAAQSTTPWLLIGAVGLGLLLLLKKGG